MTHKKRRLIILILGALMTVSPFSIDMYLPAFSQIAKDLGSTTAKISLSLASYFVGVAIGQLLYGPLLDRFGRKKPLYYGLAVYVVACIACMQSQTDTMLIVSRFVQALGGCVAMVAAMAMVRDFFPVEESAKIISLLILVLGVSPLLAPTLGSIVATYLGWQWVFIILSIIVLLIMAIAFFFLPEGHQPDPTISLKPKPMINTFLTILKHPQFHTYTLTAAFSFGLLFIYLAGSPVIFMETFKVSPQTYGIIFAILSVGFIGSNQLNILLLRNFKSDQILRAALFCQVIVTLFFVWGVWNNWFGLVATIAMFFLCLTCLGLIYPNASALSLSPFTRNVGSASALLGFFQIGISGLISTGVGLLDSKDSFPIAAMMAGTSLVALIILLAGRRRLDIKTAQKLL